MMLREELGPINSGLWVALMIVEACGFHGTLSCAPIGTNRRAER